VQVSNLSRSSAKLKVNSWLQAKHGQTPTSHTNRHDATERTLGARVMDSVLVSALVTDLEDWVGIVRIQYQSCKHNGEFCVNSLNTLRAV